MGPYLPTSGRRLFVGAGEFAPLPRLHLKQNNFMVTEIEMEIFISSLAVVLWGTFASWVQERTGPFHNLSSLQRQISNYVLTLVLPAIVTAVAPYWLPEFGDAKIVVSSLFYLLVPIGVWLASQIAHHFDPLLWLRPNEEMWESIIKTSASETHK